MWKKRQQGGQTRGGSIIIVGAGSARLSAGCYGRMNGYNTTIFDLHDKPGGLCTSWSRKGYTCDGCIHWLVGTGQGSGLNLIWRELVPSRDARSLTTKSSCP